jgi:thiosulfate/3-mercaptopyruvate sulfurtransferase
MSALARGRLADADGVAAALRSGEVVIDARVGERFRGRPSRSTRWPATSRGSVGAVPRGRRDHGRFRSPDELRERFRAVGVDDTTVPIAYCGSGVTASLDVFALRLAGLRRAALRRFVVGLGVRPVATGGDRAEP